MEAFCPHFTWRPKCLRCIIRSIRIGYPKCFFKLCKRCLVTFWSSYNCVACSHLKNRTLLAPESTNYENFDFRNSDASLGEDVVDPPAKRKPISTLERCKLMTTIQSSEPIPIPKRSNGKSASVKQKPPTYCDREFSEYTIKL